LLEVGALLLASALMAKGALISDWLPAYRRAPRHLFMPEVIWPGRAGPG
jgi:hypothetical protein